MNILEMVTVVVPQVWTNLQECGHLWSLEMNTFVPRWHFFNNWNMMIGKNSYMRNNVKRWPHGRGPEHYHEVTTWPQRMSRGDHVDAENITRWPRGRKECHKVTTWPWRISLRKISRGDHLAVENITRWPRGGRPGPGSTTSSRTNLR